VQKLTTGDLLLGTCQTGGHVQSAGDTEAPETRSDILCCSSYGDGGAHIDSTGYAIASTGWAVGAEGAPGAIPVRLHSAGGAHCRALNHSKRQGWNEGHETDRLRGMPSTLVQEIAMFNWYMIHSLTGNKKCDTHQATDNTHQATGTTDAQP
jgi:hypothetical protein